MLVLVLTGLFSALFSTGAIARMKHRETRTAATLSVFFDIMPPLLARWRSCGMESRTNPFRELVFPYFIQGAFGRNLVGQSDTKWKEPRSLKEINMPLPSSARRFMAPRREVAQD